MISRTEWLTFIILLAITAIASYLLAGFVTLPDSTPTITLTRRNHHATHYH